MPDVHELRLAAAIQDYARAVNGDHRIVTDHVLVAVSVEAATSEDVTTYTISAPGPIHSGIGLAQYALDVLRSPDDADA